MKKIILFSIAIVMMSAIIAKGQIAIPSYNVPISKSASFAEMTAASLNDQTKEKRDMNVSNGPSGNRPIQTSPTVIVYVYRLDHSQIQGPFAIPYGQTISVPIDDQSWGVSAETDAPTYLSVWINN